MVSIKHDPSEQAIRWWRRPTRQLRLFFDHTLQPAELGKEEQQESGAGLTISHCWSEAERMGVC